MVRDGMICPMLLPLLVLLLQSPEIVMHTERVEFRGNLHLNFTGFSRADMVEIIRVGKQEQPSIGISSVAVRNLTLQHRTQSYRVEVSPWPRNGSIITFRPVDVRQDSVLIITVPEGIGLSFTANSQTTQAYEFREPRFVQREPIFIYGGRVERGLRAAVLTTLYDRAKRGEIVIPVMPPFITKANLIHAETPELDREELQAVRRLLAKGSAAVFEATVTETGQVLEVLQTAALPARLPRSVMRKLEDAAMRYSYEPQVVDGRARAFRTSIVLEIPQ